MKALELAAKQHETQNSVEAALTGWWNYRQMISAMIVNSQETVETESVIETALRAHYQEGKKLRLALRRIKRLKRLSKKLHSKINQISMNDLEKEENNGSGS